MAMRMKMLFGGCKDCLKLNILGVVILFSIQVLHVRALGRCCCVGWRPCCLLLHQHWGTCFLYACFAVGGYSVLCWALSVIALCLHFSKAELIMMSCLSVAVFINDQLAVITSMMRVCIVCILYTMEHIIQV